jgi:hypothetical protein
VGGYQLQKRLGDAQEDRLAAYTFTTASWILPQAQLFDLVEVDFNLLPSTIGLYRVLPRSVLPHTLRDQDRRINSRLRTYSP